MKKLISALCVLAVAVGVSYGAIQAKKSKQGVLGIDPNVESVASKSFSTNSFFPSATFDYGYHGVGFSRFDAERISYNPVNGLIGIAYDQKHPSGFFATGGVGFIAGNEPEPANIVQSGTIYAKFPDVAGCGDYVVAFLADPLKTDQSLFISVYSKDDEGWSDAPIPVKSANNATPAKITYVHGDMTKDASGMYYLMINVIYEQVGYADRKGAVIIGKTTNPFSGTWTFSDFNDFKYYSKAGNQISNNVTNLHGAWGKNGFGFVTTMAQIDETTKYNDFMYAYTKDYGVTWNGTGAAADGYKTLKGDSAWKVFNDWKGKTRNEAADTLTGGWYKSNFDMVVDDNNDVNVLVKAVCTDNPDEWGWTWGGGVTQNADDGYPLDGFYLLKRKFDMAGNPEDVAWSKKLVGQYVGMDSNDVAGEWEGVTKFIEGEYSNTNTMSLSKAGLHNGKNVLIASWCDRPVENPMMTAEFASTSVTGIAQAQYFTFILNPYVVGSWDGGDTWEWDNTSFAPHRAFEIKSYPDRKTHEIGFQIAKEGKNLGNGGVEMYATYGIPNLAAPSPVEVAPAGANGPGTRHDRWEQDWHSMKILMNTTGIVSEPIAIEKNITLSQNYPNPFNPTTAINFTLKNAGNVNLTVYNAKGETVANLINAKMNQGTHTASFNATSLNSGVYFYKLTVGGQSAVKKMVLTK